MCVTLAGCDDGSVTLAWHGAAGRWFQTCVLLWEKKNGVYLAARWRRTRLAWSCWLYLAQFIAWLHAFLSGELPQRTALLFCEAELGLLLNL